jgi:hypothetical protein
VLQSEGAGPGWVLLLAQLPASPSGPRVALWRRARAAGAAGLQNGAWVLPHTAVHAELFGQLAETVRGQGGSAFVLAVPVADAGVDAEIAARFGADRAREYAEFAARADGLLAEIGTETGAGSSPSPSWRRSSRTWTSWPGGWTRSAAGTSSPARTANAPGRRCSAAARRWPGSPGRCTRPRAWGHPESRRQGRAGRLMLPPLTAGVRGERGRLRFCWPPARGPVRRPAAW